MEQRKLKQFRFFDHKSTKFRNENFLEGVQKQIAKTLGQSQFDYHGTEPYLLKVTDKNILRTRKLKNLILITIEIFLKQRKNGQLYSTQTPVRK